MTLAPHHPFRSAKARERYLALNDRRAERWPIPSENRTIETSHGWTFMRISGPAEAPPLVLLPGGGNHSLCWLPNIEALSASYRTYALDSIIDIGRSSNNKPLKSGEELADWLDELFDVLQLGQGIRLMGLSFGGWTAAQCALRHPERLSRLALLAPAGTVLAIKPAWLLRMLTTLMPPRRFFIKRVYSWVLADLVATGEPGRDIIEEMTEDLALAYRSFRFKRFTEVPEPSVLSDDELRLLKTPTLFMVGEHETLYSWQEALTRLAQVAPDIVCEVVRGAGHDMTWLKSEQVNRRLLEFLDEPSTSN